MGFFFEGVVVVYFLASSRVVVEPVPPPITLVHLSLLCHTSPHCPCVCHATRVLPDQYVIREEEVSYVKDGLEALVFTAAGDMRQVRNALVASREKGGGGGSLSFYRFDSHYGQPRLLMLWACYVLEWRVVFTHAPQASLSFFFRWCLLQALNNLQATVAGFSFVNADNVFKVCDQPHPKVVERIVLAACAFNVDLAVEELGRLWAQVSIPEGGGSGGVVVG